ncbi:MAG: SDR family NAD(P)-dependent oxidoreductase [Streptomyces sp.]|nr:SDR family NAD(P)-dependent oxidoreductase [Streptomyces sp.]
MGQDVLDGIAAAVAGLPGVTEAYAMVRRTTGAGAAGTSPARPTPQPATGPAANPPNPSAPTLHGHRASEGLRSSETHGPALRLPPGAPTTLSEALHAAAREAADKGTVFIRDDHGEEYEVFQSYPQLLDEARRTLSGLRAAGLRPGDAALFQFADNRNYLTAFWACALGGFIPTPVAVAPTYAEENATTRRLRNAWELLDRPHLLTDRSQAPELSRVRGLWDEPGVRILEAEELARSTPDVRVHDGGPDSPVLHLLTSGSTGVPKCVRHTNASVAARTYAVAQARGYGPDDMTMNWMPLDHVAIVMYNVRDVFLRCGHVNATTARFLADPLAWLNWMDRHRATNTWAPNFAFAMVNERAEDIARAHWDLSPLRAITNAAEPVVAATTRRFLDLLAPHGLAPDAMWPGWGMSETCSVVTYARTDRDAPGVGTVTVDQNSLGGAVRHVAPGGAGAVTFTEAGPPVPGFSMRVTGEDGQVLPEDHVGELEVTGEVMMRSYHANPEANRTSYTPDGWFRTGDLAFVHDRSMVVTGRKKDQIIVRGVNTVAHEIEAAVERVEGVEVTFVAAAAVRAPEDGSDRLSLFYVPTSWDVVAVQRTGTEIRSLLARDMGLIPDVVVPVTREEFPKTGSGKIQRGQLAADLMAGRFADRLDGRDDSGPQDAGQEGSDAPQDWICERVWGPAEEPGGAALPPGPWLVLDEDGLWEQVARHLGADDVPVVVVRAGDCPAGSGDMEALGTVLADTARRHGPLGLVVDARSLGSPESFTYEDAARAVGDTTLGVLAVLRALATEEFGSPRLLVLTRGAMAAAEGDRVELAGAAVAGLIRTAVSEGTLPVVRQVDLPHDREQWAPALSAELTDARFSGVVAHRAGHRLRPLLRPVPGAAFPGPPQITAGGCYLITGGLGGIAHELVTYLVAAYGVRPLLVGRSEVSPDGTDDRSQRLASLAALGEVRYASVDVADHTALARAVDEAERVWGRGLDGALHLAGGDIGDQWNDLDRHRLEHETEDTFTDMFRTKVSGTLSVARVLEDRPEASLTLFSSVNGEFGGSSFGAYSSANSFLSGFADHWQATRKRAVRCLSWSMWADVGMNRGRTTAPVRSRGFQAISAAQGLSSFLTAMAREARHQVIGLDVRHPLILAELVPEALRDAEIVVAYAAGAELPPDMLESVPAKAAGLAVPVSLWRLPALPRTGNGSIDAPQLLLDLRALRMRSRYTEPITHLERQLCRIWQEVLNLALVGRDDSFFEVGGNSLRATQLLQRTNTALGTDLDSRTLYENPTVGQLAAAIDGSSAAGDDPSACQTKAR